MADEGTVLYAKADGIATITLNRPEKANAIRAGMAQGLDARPRRLHGGQRLHNQAYDNMGLRGTQTLGPILDGIMRNTPEDRAFVRLARDEGVRAAVARRDAPFGDYSQAPAAQRPRRPVAGAP